MEHLGWPRSPSLRYPRTPLGPPDAERPRAAACAGVRKKVRSSGLSIAASLGATLSPISAQTVERFYGQNVERAAGKASFLNWKPRFLGY